MKHGFVYIMSNKNRTTAYVGVTNDIERRVLEHKTGYGSKFTGRYNACDLMYFETIYGMRNASDREKQLKNWHKDWKWNLVKATNPDLKDLAADWFTDEQIAEYRKLLRESKSAKDV